MAWVNQLYFVGTDMTLLIGSFGASAVLVFGAARSPLAQPRNLIGGHVVSAFAGVTAWTLFQQYPWLAAAFAVATAIAAMHLTRTLHPPGGATALVAVIGSDQIHDLGYLDSGMTSSLELLTICNEMVSQVRRFLRGIPVSPETLAVDTIAAIGPGNHYLTHPDTKAHHRQQIWMPELISRKGYETWEAEGGLTLRQRARAKLLGIMKTHEPQPLPDEVLREMNGLLKTVTSD